MDDHSCQLIGAFRSSEIWTSLISHDVTDSYGQSGGNLLSGQLITDGARQEVSPYTPSLHSCEDPSISSSLSENGLYTSEEVVLPSDASPFATRTPQSHPKRLPEGTKIITDRKARRKQQNRKSQRAFRSRKEAHQKGLEDQIDNLEQKNTRLLQSLILQFKITSQIKVTMNDLNVQIVSLQADMFHTLGLVDVSQRETDPSFVSDMNFESLH